MKKLRALFLRLAGVLRWKRHEAEMEEEMRAHLEALIERNIAAGMALEEARHAALRRFGGVEQAKEESRDTRRSAWVEQVLQDARHGCRVLRKNPGFTGVAVATLALGLGLNAAIFTLFDGFVLRPPPVPEPERVVSLYTKNDRGVAGTTLYADYVAYRERSQSFAGLAAFSNIALTLGGAGGSESAAAEERQIKAQLVSGNYFEVLGGRAVLGRTLGAADERATGATPAVVLSHGYWRRQFGGDAAVVGKPVRLNGREFVVAGVAAPDFFGVRIEAPDAWLPLAERASVRGYEWVGLLGRLKAGATLRQAQAEMDVLAPPVQALNPRRNFKGVMVRPASVWENDRSPIPVGLLLLGGVGMILLIVAANVANLSLARAAARQREIGVRLTLGASRGRIVRQLLTESALLGLGGGAAGLAVAAGATRILFLATVPAGAGDFAVDFGLNPRVAGYVLLLSLATGLIVGLAPVLQLRKVELNAALKDEGSLFGRRVSRSRLRSALAIAQIAACLMLLVGAGLLGRGLARAQRLELGYDAKRVLVVRADLQSEGYTPARTAEFHRSLKERLEAAPGIEAVSWGTSVPLHGGTWLSPVHARPDAPPRTDYTRCLGVGPDYFAALGIALRRGRMFAAAETGREASLAIVNEALAQKLWPGEDAVGRTLYSIEEPSTEVVGVVGNSHHERPGAADEPLVYFLARPLTRSGADMAQHASAIVVRTDEDPRARVALVRDAVRALDPKLLPSIRVLEDGLGEQLTVSRVGAWLAGALGGLALVVTAIGLYGVIAYATSQRTREIGVRMALGAQPGDVMRLVLGQGWRLVGAGIALGLAGAVALTRVLAGFLHGLSALDPLAFGAVSVGLAGIAMLACYLPARRAARVDPAIALRAE